MLYWWRSANPRWQFADLPLWWRSADGRRSPCPKSCAHRTPRGYSHAQRKHLDPLLLDKSKGIEDIYAIPRYSSARCRIHLHSNEQRQGSKAMPQLIDPAQHTHTHTHKCSSNRNDATYEAV
ncbi:uncharacterized protein K460DRAFT_139381 [Cucurbitaria berberidis CBS 394.84]|uniref:Uncharacterized protein n=1 Tax=Cucurbitaria berberidis CBS 394.84 TaxID=1168544 RepID=A0A9P4L5U8_9PLEO|nr:uncharacterized protein K460DRAFT_139381 [Cucurbitaria berberidis CBS 394.84]KAF1843080.1 hypothetical protein K460DRAFT_139381 [Cucurbitaria berberidis CBS 394.84]